MKKVIVSFISILLLGCGTLESNYQPGNYGPMLTVINQKLPAYDLPKKLDFHNKTYYIYNQSRDSGSGNPNDKRAIMYMQDPKSATYYEDYFIIMDDIVANAQDAQKLFKLQIAMRSSEPKVTQEGNVSYSVGTDEKNGIGYLIVSTYDESTHLARNRFYLILLNEKNDHLVKFMQTHTKQMAQEILKLGRK